MIPKSKLLIVISESKLRALIQYLQYAYERNFRVCSLGFTLAAVKCEECCVEQCQPICCHSVHSCTEVQLPVEQVCKSFLLQAWGITECDCQLSELSSSR